MVAEVRTQFGRHGAVINALIDSTEVETPGKRRRTVIPYLAVGPKERGTLGQFAEKIFENQRQPPRGIARMLRQTELRILGRALG